MTTFSTQLLESVAAHTAAVLEDLIRIPSTRGQEGPALRHLAGEMAPYVDRCDLIPVDDSLMEDPDYAFPLPDWTYQDTPNLECVIQGMGQRGPVVFNTHLDVVPASEGQPRAFDPYWENGILFGRGACDAKGQAVTLLALARLLRETGRRPAGDVIFHLVFEEENGGNGTLAMVRRGVAAEAAIVLEPSELAVIPAVRGAVWFHLETYGRAGHSGMKEATVSALLQAIQGMEILTAYHDQLLAASRGDPLFDIHADPMPLTFGQCQAGHWPASVPAVATVQGVLGFLPTKTRHQVQTELRQALANQGDPWLRENHELTFPMLNADGFRLPDEHPLVTALVAAAHRSQLPGEIKAMTAACDAWMYNNLAGIPTVVFGPGSLRYAHSQEEQIRMADILMAAQVLADFVQT